MSAAHAQATSLIKATFGNQAEVTHFGHVSGDASGRQYFRAYLANAPHKSILAMIPNEGLGPVVNWDKPITQKDTFVILERFFKGAGIFVPEILCDRRPENMLLVEDFGECTLWKVSFNQLSTKDRELISHLGADPVIAAYKKAIDIIVKLQNVVGSKTELPFCRSLGVEQYQIESRRFIDLCLAPNGYPTTGLGIIEQLIGDITSKLASGPTTLCHRDFMSWNLVLTESGKLGVLDFQDALVASSSYDLISLLNDRDTDLALGEDNYRKLYRYGQEMLKIERELYLTALTQRDLRLAGQFWNLANKLAKPHYNQFIPGCLRRLGKSLATLGKFDQALGQLSEFFPEIKSGANSPWSL